MEDVSPRPDGTSGRDVSRGEAGKMELGLAQLIGAINARLTSSRDERGTIALECAPFNLEGVLAHAVAMVRPVADEKGLGLLPAAVPRLPGLLVGDPYRLGLILINLLQNAVKFTRKGEVAVRAVLQGETADSATVRFSVCDTGDGFTPESLAELFIPFAPSVREDDCTVRHCNGNGLGLTISGHLVELMGGELWCESEVGHGSTVNFTARFGLVNRNQRPAL